MFQGFRLRGAVPGKAGSSLEYRESSNVTEECEVVMYNNWALKKGGEPLVVVPKPRVCQKISSLVQLLETPPHKYAIKNHASVQISKKTNTLQTKTKLKTSDKPCSDPIIGHLQSSALSFLS